MIQSDTKRADDVVRVRLEALIPAKKSRKKILISFILFLLASERANNDAETFFKTISRN